MACADKGCVYWCTGADWFPWEVHCDPGCDCSTPTLPCSPTENFDAKISFPCESVGEPLPEPDPECTTGQSAWRCLGGEWELVDSTCEGPCVPTEPLVDCVENDLAAGGCGLPVPDGSSSDPSTDCDGACPEDDWRHTAELTPGEVVAPTDVCGGVCAVTDYPNGVAENFTLIVPEPELAAYAELAGTWDLAYVGTVSEGFQWQTQPAGAYWRLRYITADSTWTLLGVTGDAETVEFELEGAFDPCGASVFPYLEHTAGGTWDSPLALGVVADGPCVCCSDDDDGSIGGGGDGDIDDQINGYGIYRDLSKAACVRLTSPGGTGRCGNLLAFDLLSAYSEADGAWVSAEPYTTPLGSGYWYFRSGEVPTLTWTVLGGDGSEDDVSIEFKYIAADGQCLHFASSNSRICTSVPDTQCNPNVIRVLVCCTSCTTVSPYCSLYRVCTTVPECFQSAPSFPECFIPGWMGLGLPGYSPPTNGLYTVIGCSSINLIIAVPCDAETNRLGSVAYFHPGTTSGGALLPAVAYGSVQVLNEFPIHVKIYADLAEYVLSLTNGALPSGLCNDVAALSNLVWEVRPAIPRNESRGTHPTFLDRYCEPPDPVCGCEHLPSGGPEAWLFDTQQVTDDHITYCLGNPLETTDVFQYRYASGCLWNGYDLTWNWTATGLQTPLDPPTTVEVTATEIILTFNVGGADPVVYSGPKGTGCEAVTLTLTSTLGSDCTTLPLTPLPTTLVIHPYGECGDGCLSDDSSSDDSMSSDDSSSSDSSSGDGDIYYGCHPFSNECQRRNAGNSGYLVGFYLNDPTCGGECTQVSTSPCQFQVPAEDIYAACGGTGEAYYLFEGGDGVYFDVNGNTPTATLTICAGGVAVLVFETPGYLCYRCEAFVPDAASNTFILQSSDFCPIAPGSLVLERVGDVGCTAEEAATCPVCEDPDSEDSASDGCCMGPGESLETHPALAVTYPDGVNAQTAVFSWNGANYVASSYLVTSDIANDYISCVFGVWYYNRWQGGSVWDAYVADSSSCSPFGLVFPGGIASAGDITVEIQ